MSDEQAKIRASIEYGITFWTRRLHEAEENDREKFGPIYHGIVDDQRAFSKWILAAVSFQEERILALESGTTDWRAYPYPGIGPKIKLGSEPGSCVGCERERAGIPSIVARPHTCGKQTRSTSVTLIPPDAPDECGKCGRRYCDHPRT